jgi:hypothetical protein
MYVCMYVGTVRTVYFLLTIRVPTNPLSDSVGLYRNC